MDTSIRFPNLGIEFNNIGTGIYVFGFEITYYGIIIAIGILAGICLVYREAKRTTQNPETYIDLALWSIVFSIIGARVYYVVFSWDTYKDDWLSIFNIREGGLAIYGGVLTAMICVYIFSRVKKLSFGRLVDTASIGLIAGQIIGRWGNFFNREAFGDYTNNILAMQLPISAVHGEDITNNLYNHIQSIAGVDYIQVHPTFLYESIWNLCVLIFMFWYRKRKKFEGEVFCIYLLGYGLGRAWIEGLRTDQLLIPGIGLAVSQVLAILLVLISLTIILTSRKKSKN
jgi:phosphatidylglycerol:prolipoprotein diacylglycerol transferase